MTCWMQINRKKWDQLSQILQQIRGIKTNFASRSREKLLPRGSVLMSRHRHQLHKADLRDNVSQALKTRQNDFCIIKLLWCYNISWRVANKLWKGRFSLVCAQDQAQPYACGCHPNTGEKVLSLVAAFRPKCWQASRALHSTHASLLKEHEITSFGWCQTASYQLQASQTPHSTARGLVKSSNFSNSPTAFTPAHVSLTVQRSALSKPL